jgi:hypothetical protein
MVTTTLGAALRQSGLSGFGLSTNIDFSVDQQLRLFNPDWQAPPIEWLQVIGVPGVDDVGLTSDARLVVSAAALSIMRGHRVEHCGVTPFCGVIDTR